MTKLADEFLDKRAALPGADITTRDRSAVHARHTETIVRCGALRRGIAYAVGQQEFAKLRTPPAPWCVKCARSLGISEDVLARGGPPR